MKEARIIPLKCPNCQSSECTEIGEDRYRCDFCKTKFIYREDVPQTVNNTTIYNTPNKPSVNVKYVLIGLGIFVAITIIIPVIGMLVGSKNAGRSGVGAFEAPKYRGSVEYAIPVAGKDKAYVWLYIIKRNTKGSESTFQSIIEVVDPEKNKVVKEIALSESSSSYNVSRRNAMQFIEGKCWVLLEKGIKSIDPITYEEVETSETLSKRHPRLAKGLLSCEFENYSDLQPYLEINTKDGNKFFYIVELDKVFTDDEKDESGIRYGKSAPHYPDNRPFFYFDGSGKKERLFKDKAPAPIFSIYHDGGAQDFTPGREYFFAKILYSDKDHVIITYKNDADEDNSPRMVQCLSATDGKPIWTCGESALQDFSPYSTKAVVAGSEANRQLLVCSTSSFLRKSRAVGIDMNTGKLLFTLKGEEN